MTHPGIEIREIELADVAPFLGMTFPAFRAMLVEPAARETILIGAVAANGEPLGFTFGVGAGDGYEMMSVYATPFLRRQGIGRALVDALDAAFRDRGKRHGLHSFTMNADDPWQARFLESCGYGEPVVRQLVCKTTVELACQTPWLIRATVPDGYEIELWADVTEAARRDLLQRREEKPTLYPDVLDPFEHEADCQSDTSVALMRDGTIQGWIISHVLDERTLRWTLSYVMDEIQGAGRIFPLWWDVVQRQRDQTGLERLIWTVPVETPRMLRFAQRRMRPWLQSLGYACTSVRRESVESPPTP